MPHPLQENPFLWNEFADGKLLFCNAQLLQAVRANQDWRVREFWRVVGDPDGHLLLKHHVAL